MSEVGGRHAGVETVEIREDALAVRGGAEDVV